MFKLSCSAVSHNLSYCFFTTAGQCCTSLSCAGLALLCFASQTLTAPPPCWREGAWTGCFLCLFSDFPMQLNMALFEFNGKTGYLLKHDVLRRSDKKFDPFCDRIDTVVASTLTIKAGSQPHCCHAPLTWTIPTVWFAQACQHLSNLNTKRKEFKVKIMTLKAAVKIKLHHLWYCYWRETNEPTMQYVKSWQLFLLL